MFQGGAVAICAKLRPGVIHHGRFGPREGKGETGPAAGSSSLQSGGRGPFVAGAGVGVGGHGGLAGALGLWGLLALGLAAVQVQGAREPAAVHLSSV